MAERRLTPGILRTRRLVLRPILADDAAFFHSLWHTPEVARSLFRGRDPPPIEPVREWIGERQRDPPTLFVLLAKGEPVGYAGIQPLPETGEPELFYALAPDVWGLGLAAEACEAIVVHARGALGLARLVALVHPANARSRRVIEKLGFARAGSQLHRGEEHERHELDLAASSTSARDAVNG